MKSEEKVKRLFPQSHLISMNGFVGRYWRVVDGNSGSFLSQYLPRKSWAWADAWRRVKEVKQHERSSNHGN